MPADVPHLAWPLRLAVDGRLADVEQDTLDDVRQCVRLLRATPIGARLLAPEVGLPDPTFTSGLDPDLTATRLMDEDTGEPRAAIEITAEPVDGTGRQQVTFRVQLADGAEGVDPDPTA